MPDGTDYWNDPVFQGMQPSDQMHYMASQDPDFQKMSPPDQLGYLAHIRGVGPVQGPQLPQPQGTGPTLGADTTTVPNPKTAIAMGGNDPSGNTGTAIAGLTAGAVGGLAADTIGTPVAKTASAFMKNHPFLATAGLATAQEALPEGTVRDVARKIPTWLPLMAGGAPEERPPTGRAEGGPPEGAPVSIGTVPQAGPRPNGPYSGPNTPASMEPAQSGMIAKHGYIPESRTMVTEFNNGKVYQYTGVPKEIYDNFRNAESQGSFFAQQIKGRYTTRYRGSVSPTRTGGGQ